MTKSLVGLELDYGGVLIRFTQTTAETAGALHAQEARYSPHSPIPPYHCHPSQQERFIVVEGALHFFVDGQDRVVDAGNSVDIGPGCFHRIDNPNDISALVIWETRPALRTGEFFAKMNRAARGRARPGIVDAAAILKDHQAEFLLAKPSPLVQRIVFSCLAPFGRRAVRPIDIP